MEWNKRLKAVKGNVYELDENLYDAAVVFHNGGYSGHSVYFDRAKDKIALSRIGYIIYMDRSNDFNFPLFIGWIDGFTSYGVTKYINKMVNQTLDDAYTLGKRIAFCGIWIRKMDKRTNELITARAVSRWLDRHEDAHVTLIDNTDCFNRHHILEIPWPDTKSEKESNEGMFRDNSETIL